MAAPRPKKKAPVKKTPKIVFRNIAPEPKKKIVFKTTKDDSPKKSQAAKDIGKSGMRQSILDSLKQGPSQPQGPEAPTYREKIGPKQPTAQSTTVKAPKAGVAKGLIKKIPVVGAAAGFIIDSSPAGTGSTVPGQAQKAVEKKMKREIRQGPKLAVTGVKEGTTRRLAPTGSRKPAPGSNYSGQEKKKIPMKPAPGSNYSGQSSTYSGYGNFNPSKIKTNATNTAATSTAAAGSKGGSKAAKAGGSVTKATKSGVGRQTRYQRNETAMEQKRSSNRPKKSIFSLFRKG
jgi:hypothetical protein